MGNSEKRDHWEKIYLTKDSEELSWYQEIPRTSLELIGQLELPVTARIIDVGGGDSLLADHLVELGYQDITVVDISKTALAKSRNRLGGKDDKVKWVQGDVVAFIPPEKFDFWHDRATFHFLIDENEIESYLETAHHYLNADGILLLGTFSDKGPDQCSGLPVRRYSEESLGRRLAKQFDIIRCKTVDHHTPTGNAQNFLYCILRKKSC
ncbi:MAG: class I SAM-dependent methyltransferase [Flavobacteriaceae bacterium]